MSEPILVLNCGSSRIKFAVLDANVEPLPRKPSWLGKVEGIGSRNATVVGGNAAPLAVALETRDLRQMRQLRGQDVDLALDEPPPRRGRADQRGMDGGAPGARHAASSRFDDCSAQSRFLPKR